MTEKVKLTKNQAQELEAFKEFGYTMEDWIAQRSNNRLPRSIIYELNADVLAFALYIGYEIEPEKSDFKPGDKVLRYVDGSPYIETLTMKNPYVEGDWGTEQGCGCISEEDFRHATSEEIYWLEALGREKVGELKVGDIYADKDGERFFMDDASDIAEFKRFYDKGDFSGLLPAESFKSFEEESQ